MKNIERLDELLMVEQSTYQMMCAQSARGGVCVRAYQVFVVCVCFCFTWTLFPLWAEQKFLCIASKDSLQI